MALYYMKTCTFDPFCSATTWFHNFVILVYHVYLYKSYAKMYEKTMLTLLIIILICLAVWKVLF